METEAENWTYLSMVAGEIGVNSIVDGSGCTSVVATGADVEGSIGDAAGMSAFGSIAGLER